MPVPSPLLRQSRPDVSFVMPCYNEEDSVRLTIQQLFSAFRGSGYEIEIVAVDNGSTDRSGEILRELAAEEPGIRYHRIAVNQGYGNGLIQGFPICSAEWIGIIPADGQIDPVDVVHLYEAASQASGEVLAKVRRRFRMDGFARKVVSVIYNLLIQVFWPGMQSLDINGTPKLVRRRTLLAMELSSRGWFLDPELMIKAHYLGLRILEFNAFARMRGRGTSHVRAGTCWEFVRELLFYRFSPAVSRRAIVTGHARALARVEMIGNATESIHSAAHHG